jgi:hypothetical protein
MPLNFPKLIGFKTQVTCFPWTGCWDLMPCNSIVQVYRFGGMLNITFWDDSSLLRHCFENYRSKAGILYFILNILHCNPLHVQFVLKRRSTIKAAQKFRLRTPAVTVTAEDEHEIPLYENVHRE